MLFKSFGQSFLDAEPGKSSFTKTKGSSNTSYDFTRGYSPNVTPSPFTIPTTNVPTVPINTDAIAAAVAAALGAQNTSPLGSSVTPTPQPTISLTPSVTPTATPASTPEVTPTISVTPSATPVGLPRLDDYTLSGFTLTSVQAGDIRDIVFRPDGTKMFVPGSSIIHAYNLTTPWDIGSASYGGEFSAAANFLSMSLSSDGTRFMGVRTNGDIQDGALTVAWDISTLILGNSWNAPNADHIQVRFDDETKIYIKYNDGLQTLELRTLGTAWDISTVGPVDQSERLNPLSGGPIAGNFVIDPVSGDALYAIRNGTQIVKFPMTANWEVDTMFFDTSQTLEAASLIGEFPITAVFVRLGTNPNGRIWVNGGNTAEIYEFTL